MKTYTYKHKKPHTTRVPLLCLALLLALMLPLVAACTPDAPSPADTAPESQQSSEAPITGSITEPVTEPVTDAPHTEPVTDALTESVTDHPEPVPPVEDLSMPEGAAYVFDAQALKAAARVSTSSVLHTEEDFPYVTFRARSEGYVNIVSGKAFAAGRYIRIKYRTQESASGQLLIGDKAFGTLPYKADGQWHILTVDLYDLQCYSPVISRLGFRPGVDDTKDMKQVDLAWVATYADDGAPYDESVRLAGLPALTPGMMVPVSSALHTQDKSVMYLPTGSYTGTDGNGTYSFKEDFRLSIYMEETYFNRYTLGYSSASPLRGEITYVTWGANGAESSHSEVFFLEAGDDMTFSCLIDGYLAGEYAFRISSLSLRTCDGSTTTFSLLSLTTQVARVYATGEYYLENDRYRLGVLLSWGGGISYIEDKLDGDEHISNLINRADTGRLVQQSYYGVGNGPYYTSATYNGTVWSYNPVQGGDQHNNASKLVDVQVSEDGNSIYIKCRPMDWAQNNSLTPSYMENVYTLREDAIHVSNRFVDFFGVRHGAHHAELPAFYTISYLGVFHYYNGTKPWTGDAYETLPNEAFWAGRKSAYHNILAGNTETWAAWTSPEGYGIGLYVPGAEILLAGRHAYNGSKNPADGGTSYVAPLRTMEFFSFVPFSYEYVISTGTVEEMRATFATYAEQMGQ